MTTLLLAATVLTHVAVPALPDPLLRQAAQRSAVYMPQPGETVMQMNIEGRGSLTIRLFTKDAPRTTEHIMALARQGFYDNQRFYRVDRTPRPYLARFGDPQSKNLSLDHPNMGNGGSGKRIAYEDSGRRNVIGAVGLSHPPDDKDGGDSQFYIVLGPAQFLDGNYTVFGQVVAGMDLLQQISKGDKVASMKISGQ
jgi:cyclophilin family peptidyl-prolyl cis-trans isomerase